MMKMWLVLLRLLMLHGLDAVAWCC